MVAVRYFSIVPGWAPRGRYPHAGLADRRLLRGSLCWRSDCNVRCLPATATHRLYSRSEPARARHPASAEHGRLRHPALRAPVYGNDDSCRSDHATEVANLGWRTLLQRVPQGRRRAWTVPLNKKVRAGLVIGHRITALKHKRYWRSCTILKAVHMGCAI